MEDKKSVAVSLRITEERFNQIKEKATEIGISQNAFINVLLDLGFKFYEVGLFQNFQSQNKNSQCL